MTTKRSDADMPEYSLFDYIDELREIKGSIGKMLTQLTDNSLLKTEWQLLHDAQIQIDQAYKSFKRLKGVK